MLSALPQELIDIIIDHLHDDTTTLIACSTTCYSLLPTCSLHLFRHVTLGRRTQLAPSQFLPHFLAVLDESPRICSHVQKFTLTMPLHHRRRLQRRNESCATDLRMLRDVLVRLVCLRTVEMQFVQILPLPEGDRLPPLLHSRLEKVLLGTLHSAPGPQDPSLQSLLSLFSGVAIDDLELLGRCQGAPDSYRAILPSIRISSLSFVERDPSASKLCLEALRVRLDPMCLVALRARLLSFGALDALDTVIQAAAPSLRNLFLDLTELGLHCTGALSFLPLRLT
jgi:hypothetical protein